MTSQAALNRFRVISNPNPKTRISKLIAAHKKAAAAAKRAGAVLDAFPEEVQTLPRVNYGQFSGNNNVGEKVTGPLYAYSHQDLDRCLENEREVAKLFGDYTIKKVEARAAALHAEFDKAEAEKKAARLACGYTKAARVSSCCASAEFNAIYELTRVSPASLREAAELAAYLGKLAKRDALSSYMRKRFFKALSQAK